MIPLPIFPFRGRDIQIVKERSVRQGAFLFANSVNAHGVYTGPKPDELPELPSASLS